MFSVGYFIEATFLGLALAMDCFTVSITCGLQKTMSRPRSLFLALSFAFFQAFMPFIGSFLGTMFYSIIESIAAWVAFALLFVIGLKMMMEAKNFSLKSKVFDVSSLKVILLLSIATSIDAMAVGMSFSGMGWLVGEQIVGVVIIFIVTFIMSIIGVIMGEKVYFIKPSFALNLGGIILILIGVKTIVQHYIETM